MKKVFLLLLLGMVCFMAQAQTNLFDAAAELERVAGVPNAPEAEAFTKYGDIPVSLYTGTPNIQVPIYTIQGREMGVPISLSYDASGIKIEQLATQVGLGWNLNVGGRISRIANGFPDDFRNANPEYFTIWDNVVQQGMLSYINENTYFATEQEVSDYFYFLKDVSINKYDTQPDYFSLNALGINDYIVFDVATRIPRTLHNPRIKVEFTQDATTSSITEWVITNEGGTKFHFEVAEETHYQGEDPYIDETNGEIPYGMVKDYNSSWLLTKIESPNRKDTFTFSYTAMGFWTQPQSPSPVQSIVNNMDDGNQTVENYPIEYGNRTFQNSEYNINQQVLSEIHHNGDKMLSIDLKSRLDIVGVNSAVDNIHLYLPDQSTAFKTFTFYHSYFGDVTNSPVSTLDDEYIRLKLDSLEISAPGSTEIRKFSFEYESPELLPSRVSLAQDYLGYYNGANSNTVLYPSITIDEDTYGGADRDPDFNFAKIGILTKMTYPTGGHSIFEFEPHTTPYDYDDNINEQEQEVIYAQLGLTGGIDNSTPCNYYCQDLYGATPPKVASLNFTIQEAGVYDFSFTNVGDNLAGVFPLEAFIFLRQPPTSGGTVTCPSSTLAYDEVYDQSGYVQVDFAWYFTEGNQSKYLEPGCYEMMLVNRNPNRTISAKVSRDEVVSSSTIGQGAVERAGIRVASIKNYAKDGELATEKRYSYSTSVNGPNSSGKVVFRPYLSYMTQGQINVTQAAAANNPFLSEGINSVQYMNRVSTSSGGSRPHVAYSKVFEQQISNDGNNGTLGYTQHEFYNDGNGSDSGSGIYSNGLPPFLTYYISNHEVGKEKNMKQYDDSGSQKTLSEYAYEDHLYYINKGIAIKREPGNTFKYPKVVQSPTNGLYTYEFIDAEINCLYSYYLGINCHSNPQPCIEPGCLNDLKLAGNTMQVVTAGGRIGNTIQVKTTNYYNGVEEHQQVDMSYDSSIDWLLRESITTDSDDRQLKTTYTYPKDLTDAVSTAMVTGNRLTDQLQVETFREGQRMSIRKNNYAQVGQGFQVAKIEIAKGTDHTIESRVEFEYDTNGNAKQAKQANGTAVSYAWGYDAKYPIAKLDNVEQSGITASQQTAIDAAISASNADVDETTEDALRTALAALRAEFPEAMVTTYTYDPMVGVTSITDARGRTTYYLFDEHNRLKQVKDAEGKILSENEYNYRPQN